MKKYSCFNLNDFGTILDNEKRIRKKIVFMKKMTPNMREDEEGINSGRVIKKFWNLWEKLTQVMGFVDFLFIYFVIRAVNIFNFVLYM